MIETISRDIIRFIGAIFKILCSIVSGMLLFCCIVVVLLGVIYLIKVEFSLFFNMDISPRLTKFFNFLKRILGPAFRKLTEPIDTYVDKHENFDPFDKWAQR